MGGEMKEKDDVKKRLLLPEAIYRVLGEEGLKKEDILYKAEPDLDGELRFTRNYLVITAKKLVLVCFPYEEHGKFRFGGYAGNEMAAGFERQPEIKSYSIEEIEKLEIIRALSGGSLMGIIEGKEVHLCAFSNSRMSEMERAKRNLDKIKKSEELKPEDISDEFSDRNDPARQDQNPKFEKKEMIGMQVLET